MDRFNPKNLKKRGTPSGVYLFRAKLVSRMTLLLPSSSKWRISHQTRQRPSLHRVSRKLLLRRKRLQSRSISDVCSFLQYIFNHPLLLFLSRPTVVAIGCIVYTWDHRSSALIWSGLKVQPILADEVQTFKALIMVHKILKDGHPVVSLAFEYMSNLSSRGI